MTLPFTPPYSSLLYSSLCFSLLCSSLSLSVQVAGIESFFKVFDDILDLTLGSGVVTSQQVCVHAYKYIHIHIYVHTYICI